MKYSALILMLFVLFSCDNKQGSTSKGSSGNDLTQEKSDFISEAQNIAVASQKALGGQLKAKLEEGGPINALEFCSVQAIPITDSLSKAHNVSIRRVSDKNRNPSNKVDEKEMDYMSFVEEQIKNGITPTPNAQVLPDGKIAYFPITTNAMCLQCHGTVGETLSEDTYAKIQELYPKDLATGYGEGELRGIWVIEMLRQ